MTNSNDGDSQARQNKKNNKTGNISEHICSPYTELYIREQES